MSVNKSKLTKSIQKRGDYSIVPNEIWSMPLSKSAKITYVYIISQSDSWNPGTREIAEGTSSSLTTVRAALKELKELNMIEIHEGPHGLRNVYEINGTNEWNFQARLKEYQPITDTKLTGPAKRVSGVDQSSITTGLKEYHIQEESNKKIKEEISNQNNSFKDEDFEIDLSMDSSPVDNKSSSPSPMGIAANPSLNKQIHAPVQFKEVAPQSTSPKSQITPEAILAKWKPHRVDSKDLENQVAELFTTLKHYSIPKDELSTKKIIKTMFGPMPSKKIDWLVEKATQVIDEQRELIYAPEIEIQQAPLEQPVSSGQAGQLRRRDFSSDEAYALYYEAITNNREIHSLGGSIVEYYEQRAYASSFPIAKPVGKE